MPLRTRLLTVLCSCLAVAACGPSASNCPEPSPSAPASNESTEYDPTLAQRLGADEYGMRSYVIAFLRAGPNRSEDEQAAKQLMRAHLDNIRRLAQAGKLVVAGPFLDDGDLRGIYVFAVASIEEAAALTASDPAIESGHLVMELHPWYGSAALMDVSAISERIEKSKI